MKTVRSKICKKDSESDITGEHVSIGEPYIMIKGIVIKLQEILELKEYLEKRKMRDFFNCSILPGSVSKCEICDSTKKGIKLKKDIRKNGELKINVCKECVSELINRIKVEEEEIRDRIRYWDKTGFFIQTPSKTSPTDFIERDIVKEESYVLYIIGNSLQTFSTRLENITIVLESIEKEINREFHKGLSCQRCKSPNSTRIFDKLKLCEDCATEIKNSLDRYICTNKKLIISSKI